MKIGDTITVSKEKAKDLRKQGWMPRGDIVTMMYVGQPENPRSNISRATANSRQKHTDERWAQSYKARMAQA